MNINYFRTENHNCTSIELFKLVNDWLSEHKLLRRDNSLIVTHFENNAALFSNTETIYYIFPIGKFNYTYCKSLDFNIIEPTSKFKQHFFVYKFLKENPEWAMKNYKRFLKSPEFKTYDELSYWLDSSEKIEMYLFRTYTYTKQELEDGVKNLDKLILKRNIQDAHKNDYETWINPKSFYKLSKSTVDKLNIK